MLTQRYLASTKNLSTLLAQLTEGVAPDKFTIEYLKSAGFTSSHDRAFIPLMKDLGFLTPDGVPTQRYHAYRDKSRSDIVLGEALRDAYEDVFQIREFPKEGDREAIKGLFKSKLNSSERVAQLQAMTFLALLKHADISSRDPGPSVSSTDVDGRKSNPVDDPPRAVATATDSRIAAELHYTIQVHLPATKDIEVYNAIFRSLNEHLLR